MASILLNTIALLSLASCGFIWKSRNSAPESSSNFKIIFPHRWVVVEVGATDVDTGMGHS